MISTLITIFTSLKKLSAATILAVMTTGLVYGGYSFIVLKDQVSKKNIVTDQEITVIKNDNKHIMKRLDTMNRKLDILILRGR